MKTKLTDRFNQLARACITYTMEQPDRVKLFKLSPKKRTALECGVYAIDKIKSLTPEIKKSWFGWIYYMCRLINDKEVDQLMLSSHYASETYMMKHFAKDFVSQFTDPKKIDMAKCLFKDYDSINGCELEDTAIVKEFNQYVI